MATFAHSEHQTAIKPLDVDGGTKLYMNGKKTVMFSFHRAEVLIQMEDGSSRPYTSQRGVIVAPHGAKVLPYFKFGKEWFVVMVEQFRIALPDQTLEAAGGEVDEKDPIESMVRELQEEAGIPVPKENINLVYAAYIQPSMMAAKAYGGIARIKKSWLPRTLIGGEWAQNEYTVLCVQNLLDLLRARNKGELVFDLETWMLLDAVATKVGLIKKHY